MLVEVNGCRSVKTRLLSRIMAAQRAAALFVPTNNGMPQAKGGPELVAEARNIDIARAIENNVAVVRADCGPSLRLPRSRRTPASRFALGATRARLRCEQRDWSGLSPRSGRAKEGGRARAAR